MKEYKKSFKKYVMDLQILNSEIKDSIFLNIMKPKEFMNLLKNFLKIIDKIYDNQQNLWKFANLVKKISEKNNSFKSKKFFEEICNNDLKKSHLLNKLRGYHIELEFERAKTINENKINQKMNSDDINNEKKSFD